VSIATSFQTFGSAGPGTGNDEIILLLSRLDLNRSGLEKVKESSVDPSMAAEELLKYYKSRTSVKHPVDRSKKADGLGKSASSGEIKMADNA